MTKPGNKKKNTKGSGDEPRISEGFQKRTMTEQDEIDQTRIENRREADLEDKTPAGDAGVEDNTDERSANDPLGESNY